MSWRDWEQLLAGVQAPFLGLRALGVQPAHAGKVREIIDLGATLLMVTTDRLSAFDQVLPGGIPGRGILLNQLSLFWFERLAPIIPHHVIDTQLDGLPPPLEAHRALLAGRTMRVHKAQRVPVECVVRGWLAGAGLADYQARGAICGVPLPPGLAPFARLPEPIFTPTTKADAGHDEPLSPSALRNLVGEELARKLQRTSLELYRHAARHAEERGVVIADTKFEFGWIAERLALIDEALTPDSSRFWPRESVGPGKQPVSLDKQAVRDYLKAAGWQGEGPAPQLPEEVVGETVARYARALRLLATSDPLPDGRGAQAG